MATSLKIDDTLKGRVQHLANQRRRSPHWIMLEAIQQQVIVTEGATEGLERCRQFLSANTPEAAKRAGQAI